MGSSLLKICCAKYLTATWAISFHLLPHRRLWERKGRVSCVCVCVKDSNYPHSMWTELYCSVGCCAANILPPPVFLLIWTVSVHTSWTVLLIHILSFNFCTRFVSLHNITRSMGQRKDGKTHTVFLIKGQRHHCVCRPCVETLWQRSLPGGSIFIWSLVYFLKEMQRKTKSK